MKSLLKIFFSIIAIFALVRLGTSFLKTFNTSNTSDSHLPLWSFSVEEEWFDNRNRSCKDFKNAWGTKYEYDDTFDEIKYCLVVREKCWETIVIKEGVMDRGCVIKIREDFGLRNK